MTRTASAARWGVVTTTSPLLFGFATLCSVFLAFGALAAKDQDPVRARRGEDSEGTP